MSWGCASRPSPMKAAIIGLLSAATSGQRIRAHFCNVHTLVEATKRADLKDALRSAQMVATDGVPLVWVLRARGYKAAQRVAGPDVMLSLCDRGRPLALRHYFVGGRPGVPELLASKLEQRYPGLLSPERFRLLSGR